jgi:hypothetical protein
MHKKESRFITVVYFPEFSLEKEKYPEAIKLFLLFSPFHLKKHVQSKKENRERFFIIS